MLILSHFLDTEDNLTQGMSWQGGHLDAKMSSSIWCNFANLAIQNVFILPSGSVAC